MTIQSDIALADWCTLSVGGPARYFCRAASAADLLTAMTWAAARDLAVHVLGGGSNVVFADEGFDGLVVQVNVGGIDTVVHEHVTVYRVGAGEPWDSLVAATVAAGCAGLECLSGIPGLVGGTPVQNVGAYGQDVAETIRQVQVIDRRAGREITLPAAECGFGYRSSRFKGEDRERFIVTRVDYALRRGGLPTLAYADVIGFFQEANHASPTLAEVRDAVIRIRRRKGMVIDAGNPARHSVGSFFVNPVLSADHFARTAAAAGGEVPHYPLPDGSVKVPAAWLIERAGFAKGHRRGPVGISPFQAQAIVNLDGACAQDVLHLATAVKRAVWKTFRIAIVPEPVFVGFAASPELRFLQAPDPLGAD